MSHPEAKNRSGWRNWFERLSELDQSPEELLSARLDAFEARILDLEKRGSPQHPSS
jgi:hypothetical protein